MKTLRIASNLALVNNLQMVVACPDKSIELVQSPNAQFINGAVIANFDYYIDVGLVPSDDLSILLGDKYINAKRYGKREQMMLLEQAGLNTPATAFPINFPGTGHVDHNLLVGLATGLGCTIGDGIVFKVGHGARGMGQAKVNYKNLTYFTKRYIGPLAKPINLDDERIQWGGSVEDSEEPLVVKGLTSSNDYIISKHVGIKSEYRMLFNSAGNCVIVARELAAQAGWQARGGDGEVIYEGAIHEIKSSVLNLANTDAFKKFLEGILKLVSDIGYPFGSIDIFVGDVVGNVGVFEFSPQFAHAAVNPNTVRKLTIDGLNHTLRQP